MANLKYLATRNDGMRGAKVIELDDRYDLRGNIVEYDEDSRDPGFFLNLRICTVGRGGSAAPTKSGFMLKEGYAEQLVEMIAELAGFEVTIHNNAVAR